MVDFASNPTFIAPVVAPYLGQATKVAMTAAQRANGFVPGGPVAAEHLNQELNAITARATALEAGVAANVAADALLTRAFLENHLFAVGLIYTTTPPPVLLGVPGLAAAFDPVTRRTLLVKGGAATGCSHVVADDMYGMEAGGNTGTLTNAQDAAYDPVAGRVVLVGTGGTFAAFQTFFGTGAWTNATTAPPARDRVVWNVVNGLFVAGRTAQATVYTSPNGVTWTSRALPGASSGKLATLTSGRLCSPRGTGSSIVFDTSTNGTTWAVSAGTLPDVATATAGSPAAIAAIGNTFYAAAYFSALASLHVYSSPDAGTWTLISTIALPAAGVSTGASLLADPYSGVLYACSKDGNFNTYVYASVDAGLTWVGPASYINDTGGGSMQAVGGRLWMNTNAVHMGTVHRWPSA